MYKSIPEISIESNLLYQKLIKMEVNEVIVYSTLSQIAGRNIQTVSRGSLYKAIEKAGKENKMAFHTIRGIGIKRADDIGIIDASGTPALNKIRRISARAVKKLSLINDFKSLPQEKQSEALAYNSIHQMIKHETFQRNILKVINKCQETCEKLPLGKTLEIFKN